MSDFFTHHNRWLAERATEQPTEPTLTEQLAWLDQHPGLKDVNA